MEKVSDSWFVEIARKANLIEGYNVEKRGQR